MSELDPQDQDATPVATPETAPPPNEPGIEPKTPEDGDEPKQVETAEPADGDEPTKTDDEPEKQRPKKTVQDRIDQLTAQRREAERRAANAEQRYLELNERLQQRPEIPLDDFEGHETQRLRDVMNEERQQDAARELQVAEEERQRATSDMFFAKVDAAFGDQAQEFAQKFANVPVSDVGAQILAESDVGAQVAYYLTQNPGTAAQIAQLPPVQQARALTQIEARISAAPKARKQTQAPPPVKTVTATAAPGQKTPQEMSMEEYRAWRNGGSK